MTYEFIERESILFISLRSGHDETTFYIRSHAKANIEDKIPIYPDALLLRESENDQRLYK